MAIIPHDASEDLLGVLQQDLSKASVRYDCWLQKKIWPALTKRQTVGDFCSPTDRNSIPAVKYHRL